MALNVCCFHLYCMSAKSTYHYKSMEYCFFQVMANELQAYYKVYNGYLDIYFLYYFGGPFGIIRKAG